MEEYNSQELISDNGNEDNIINSPTEFQSENTENYITDSDIDDIKYQPNHQIQFNTSFNKSNNKSNNKNNVIQNIQNNNNEINNIKINQQYESQIIIYKNEILKLQEIIKSKDSTIKEIKESFPLFDEKFNKLENKNTKLKQEKNE